MEAQSAGGLFSFLAADCIMFAVGAEFDAGEEFRLNTFKFLFALNHNGGTVSGMSLHKISQRG